MRDYCTIADRGFVAQLLALHSSMEKWCKPFKLWVLCLDRDVEGVLRRLNVDSIEPVYKSCVETQAARSLKKERPYKQYIWTLKPLWILEMLRRCSESITYLDADGFFFCSPSEVYKEIGDAAIAITPHRFSKRFSGREKIAGTFNAGFIYFKKGAENVDKCTVTWANQVLARCERRPKEGFYDDQMYLDNWPERWGAYSIRHKGFNLAPWNQGDGHYRYEVREHHPCVDDDRLIWYHFHQGPDPSYRLEPFVKAHIYEPYQKALDEAGSAQRGKGDSTPMITLFTIPRAFTGEDKIRQENTLGSWTRLTPRPEIILFCDDPGVAEAAKRFGCVHVPDIRCNEKGTPFIGDAFRLASQLATNDTLCYANADIILIQDFIAAVETAARHFDQPFLIIGQRWDVSVPEPLKFTGDWQQRLRAQARRRGNLHSPSAIDYFVYSRGAVVGLPDFLVGSPKWDNWLVKDAEKRGLQVVSATKAITCIHQRHKRVTPAKGVQYNKKLWQESGGGLGYAYSGSWVLDSGARLRRKGEARVVLSRVTARPKHKHKSARPARAIPRDELGLPINLNVPIHELEASAKRLRREAKAKVPARKKHSHSGSPEKESLLAERARLRQVRETIRAARVEARDAKLRRRRRKNVAPAGPKTTPKKRKRETPRGDLGLPVNLKVPVQGLADSAKRLRRAGSKKTKPRKGHKHMTPRDALLAQRARLREIQKTILMARVKARDARLLKRKKG